jgi:uncharacterized spore protein YtfJ
MPHRDRVGPASRYWIHAHQGEKTMDAHEVLDHARDAMTVKRVFGDLYERGGVAVIPVANVMGGAGAGGGPWMRPQPASGGEEAVGDVAADAGFGMGYGLRASPAGVYVIRGDQVEWKPAVDMNRLTLQRAGVALVGLLVLRSIIRTLARR